LETGTQEDQESLTAAIADDRLASAAYMWPGASLWPQPTGIGDLDDLGNCPANKIKIAIGSSCPRVPDSRPERGDALAGDLRC
jgi:hypothetical protein